MDNSVLLQFDPLDSRTKPDDPDEHAFDGLFGGPKPTGLKPSKSKRHSINLIDLGASPLVEGGESSEETDEEHVGNKTSRLVDAPRFNDGGSGIEDEKQSPDKLTSKPHGVLASVQVRGPLPADPFSPPCLVKLEAPLPDTTSLYSSQNTLRYSQSSTPRTPPPDFRLSTNFTPVPENMHYLPTSSLSSLHSLKMSEFDPARRRSSVDLEAQLEGRLHDASFDLLNGELNLSTMGDVSFTSIGAEGQVKEILPPIHSLQHESDDPQPQVLASKGTTRTKTPITVRKVPEGKLNSADSPGMHLGHLLDTQSRLATTKHPAPPSNDSPLGRQDSKAPLARFRKPAPSAPTRPATAVSRRNSIFPSTRVDLQMMPAGASKSQAITPSHSPGKRTLSIAPEAPRSPNRASLTLASRASVTATKHSTLMPSTALLSAARAPPARNSTTQTHRRTSTIATSRPSTILRPRESIAPAAMRRMSTLGSTASNVKGRESAILPLSAFPKKPVRSSIISGLSTRTSSLAGRTVAQRSSATSEVAKSTTSRKFTTGTTSTSASSRTLSSALSTHTPQVPILASKRGLRRTSSVGAASGEGLKAAAAVRQAIASRPRPSTSLGRVPISHSNSIRPLKARPSVIRPITNEAKLGTAARTSTTRVRGKP